MSRCRGKHRKAPALECGLTSEAVAIDSHGPRAGSFGLEKGGSTDRSDAQLIRLWICDVFLFPCQARESGLLVAASPVPVFVPAWLQGHGGTTNELQYARHLNQMLPDA